MVRFANNVIIIISIACAVISVDLNAQSTLPFKNLGPKINTANDEYLPVVYNDTLYFRRVISSSPRRFIYDIYKIACEDLNFMNDTSRPYVIGIYNTPEYGNSSEPVDPTATTGRNAVQDPSTPGFFDFTSDKLNYYKLDDPKKITGEVNTGFNDMHPAMSPDGSFMVFASDRPRTRGSVERSKDLDLYITYRNEDNTWSKPVNLGKEINTKENDFTPYIAENGNLYFSSKGYIRDSVNIVFSGESRKEGGSLSDIYLIAERPNYNIIVANSTGDTKKPFAEPRILPSPINTEFNETGPTVWNDSIFFIASDRISPYDRPDPNNQFGYDIYGHVYSPFPEQPPQPPDMPFFVTGYYIPNTERNLDLLRKKFYEGRYGTNRYNDYVANPDFDVDENGDIINYDQYAVKVDKYFKNVNESLQKWIEYAAANDGRVDVYIKGYSDPRPIAGASKYIEQDIKDPEMDFFMRNGTSIDNIGLSALRAYFTAYELRDKLIYSPDYNPAIIRWVLEGAGIYEGENENIKRRRVEIYVRFYKDQS